MSAPAVPAATEQPLHVIATAGHVDHGKSSLIIRLTGIDPDRWEEEKRRGLTIDLGFAWCTLPSGREVGFVDVPGHERFVRNMLAGVGPVRVVLFVVAADEGWKPQSEEHLAIVDVLGAEAGVVAITKTDLVDAETLAIREREVADRLRGTVLGSAAIIACSSTSGEGMDALASALDDIAGSASPPEDRGRPRINIDRSFTIRGAGTVVTGTLIGGSLAVGDEVELYPARGRARVRSLQTHRRPVQVARPVSRVAVNLAGTSKEQVERGDVLATPGAWRPTSRLEVRLVPIRGLDHPITARGAYKLYLGTAERDARLRLYGGKEIRSGESGFASLTLSAPVITQIGDRFVLREAGRRETVAGGTVLDIDPPSRPGPALDSRLARRETASPETLPGVIVAERGAIRASEIPLLAGSGPATIPGATRIGPWWVSDAAVAELTSSVTEALAAYHRDHPLRAGLDLAEVRRVMLDAVPSVAATLEGELASTLLELLERDGTIARAGNTVRMASHQVTLGGREDEAERLVALVAEGQPTPPTVTDLEGLGYPRELIGAACDAGRLARISPEIVLTPEFGRRAEELALKEAAQPDGLTVSRFREMLGTTRKYALPILAWLDDRGLTRRDGNLRRLNR